jgi:hypothetical protein
VPPTQLRNWVKAFADDLQHAFPGQGQMKPEQKKPESTVKFGFIAKHRGIWPADWICGALGVSRGGFYGWLTRSRSKRSCGDEELGRQGSQPD